MFSEQLTPKGRAVRAAQLYGPDDFNRADQSDDQLFYAKERMVSHLDATARQTVRRIIQTLITEEKPAMLDLMASWDSHIPPELGPSEVVGLGLNRAELDANPLLTGRVYHDLNRDPALPFAAKRFDAVINVVSVDYLTRPVEIFKEVARTLKPGGLFLIIFSNRWFEPKVTNIWRRASENERICLVQEWLESAGGFTDFGTFVSKELPRPAGDKYAHLGIPSDPIYAMWAVRKGARTGKPARPYPSAGHIQATDPAEVARRAELVAQTLECPHCGQRLRKWAVPQTPFTEWDNEYMHICFNDDCPYLLRGFEAMSRQGNTGNSYRLMYNPATGSVGPVMVQSMDMLKDGIIDG